MNSAQEAKRGFAVHLWVSWLVNGLFLAPMRVLRKAFKGTDPASDPLSRSEEKQRRKALVREFHRRK